MEEDVLLPRTTDEDCTANANTILVVDDFVVVVVTDSNGLQLLKA